MWPTSVRGGEFGVVVDPETGALVEIFNGPEGVEERCGVSGANAVANPDAEPGTLCVFAGTEEKLRALEEPIIGAPNQSDLWISPAPESGAVVPFSLGEQEIFEFPASTGGYADGSWAVNTE